MTGRNPLSGRFEDGLIGKEFGALIRFGLVGLANTGLSVGLMVVLSLTGMPLPVYTTIAYIAGTVCSFCLNRRFTFRDGKDRQAKRFLRFGATTLFLLACVQLIQYVSIDLLHAAEPAGIALGMIFYTGFGFIINRLWVFSKTRTAA